MGQTPAPCRIRDSRPTSGARKYLSECWYKLPHNSSNGLTPSGWYSLASSGSPAPVRAARVHEESPPTCRAGDRAHARGGRPSALEQRRHVSVRPMRCANPRRTRPRGVNPPRDEDGGAMERPPSPVQVRAQEGSPTYRADAQPNAGMNRRGLTPRSSPRPFAALATLACKSSAKTLLTPAAALRAALVVRRSERSALGEPRPFRVPGETEVLACPHSPSTRANSGPPGRGRHQNAKRADWRTRRFASRQR